ncbi:hypothetical protein [Arthrobacter antioxidans]|uniref:hypothetical protein n=1 Tax=Arthrobacter antioxidans TaxID=2895818 RepID=UPI001FFF1A35|nr:hypothetical protein [Arthrobacter antioxidans]
MAPAKVNQEVIIAFTSKEWDGRAAKQVPNMFVGFIVIGYVLGLILMIFIAPLRSFNALSLFAVVTSVLFTALAISGERSRQQKFLSGVAATINTTILELTGNPQDQLPLAKVEDLVTHGQRIPLLVNGVSGLQLTALRETPPQPPQFIKKDQRIVSTAPDAVVTTRVVITITPPEYGITSFDKLLAAAHTAT